MATFYGYAEREAGDQVDWSVIGSDITKMLKEEVTRRDELKSEIDKATRAYGTTLSEAPTGQHQGASDAVIDYAANAQSARLVQDKLLKSGQLKVKDYLRQRQNLLDGTNTMFAAAKAVQEETAIKIERMMQEGSGYEMALFKASEGFTNWNNVGAYIDPTSYRVSLGKKIRKETADGKVYYEMGDSPGDFLTASELYNFATLKMDRIDLEKPMDEIAANMGPIVQTILKDGKLITVKDATGRILDQLQKNKEMSGSDIKVIDKFNNALNDAVDKLYSNPIENGSIAYDYYGRASNGKNFKFVWTKEEMEASPENIYLEKDPAGGPPTPIFHEGEEEDLKKKTKRSIIQRISQTYEEKTEFRKIPKTAAVRAFEANLKNKKATATQILKDWIDGGKGGSTKELSESGYQNVADYYNSLHPEEDDRKLLAIDKIDDKTGKTAGKIQFIWSDGKSKPINLTDKKAYIRAIKSIFPTQFQESGLSEKELEGLGEGMWSKKGPTFNVFESSQGMAIEVGEPGSFVLKTDPDTYEETTADDMYAKNNKGTPFGAFKSKADNLAKIGSDQIRVLNKTLKGTDKLDLSIQSKGDKIAILNPENSAQIDIVSVDGQGMGVAQKGLMANIINYKTGKIQSDQELESAYIRFLEDYRAAIYNSQYKGTGQEEKLITLAGTDYSYDDMVITDPDTKEKTYTSNFDKLIEMAKALNAGSGAGAGATTTTTTTTTPGKSR